MRYRQSTLYEWFKSPINNPKVDNMANVPEAGRQ